MSARISSLKSNILKNKNSKIFSKTITSNFMKSSEKNSKANKELGLTKSTRFSENNVTETIASSIRSISKFKSRKKEKPILFNIEDFHKQFLLNKNKDRLLSNIYFQIGFRNSKYIINSINNNYEHSNKKNIIKLKKNPISPSFFTSYNEKSRNILIMNNLSIKIDKDYLTNSNYSSFFEKNKTLYSREKNNTSRNQMNYSNNYTINNKEYFHSNFIRNLSLSPENLKEYKSIQASTNAKNKLNNKINTYSNSLHKTNYKIYNINNNSNNNINEIKNKKTKANFDYYMGRIHVSLNEKLAYPTFNNYIFANSKINENGQQFLYKIKLMILQNYYGSIKKDSYIKQMSINENNLENQNLIKKRLELMKKLFYIYNKTLDEYIRYLLKKLRIVNEENENLTQDIMTINNEIERIRQKLLRGLNKMKNGFSIKYFLMCVKNHTISIEKFNDEDIEIIENDRLKLNLNYYSNALKNKLRQSSRINPIYFRNKKKKIQVFSSEKNVIMKNYLLIKQDDNEKIEHHKSTENILFDNPKNISQSIFNSVEEFLINFDDISSKVNQLIREYNDKNVNIIYLKNQLEHLNQNVQRNKNNLNLLNNKIKIYEQNLENIKNKHKELTTKLNYHQDDKLKNNVKIILVLKYIYRIYNNIRKNYDILNIKQSDIANFGQKIYLKYIEDFFIKILDKVNKDKIRYPEEYEKMRQQIEKRKKNDAFILFQNLLAQKIEIKIDNVLKRASKIIYKRLRKTNDYNNYYKSAEIIKKEGIEKNEMDLFFEYLEDKGE